MRNCGTASLGHYLSTLEHAYQFCFVDKSISLHITLKVKRQNSFESGHLSRWPANRTYIYFYQRLTTSSH